MIRWNNDYNRGAHPAVLKKLQEINDTEFSGYSTDVLCEEAAGLLKKEFGREDAEVHFLVGGTQTNVIVISCVLRSYQAVICADTAHIFAHETGALEHIGYKLLAIPGTNGKITAEQVKKEAEYYRSSLIKEHIVQPKVVSISFPTEFGSIYSRRELEDLREVCDEYGLYLYIDGARMGCGLAAAECDVTLKDIADLADAFYIGGTKCGAFFGEAVVLLHDDFKDHFRSHIKQNGAMLGKGWLLGAQFCALFEDGLYYRINRHAVELAMKIRKAFLEKGLAFQIDSCTNQLFVIVTEEQMKKLGEKHIYEYEEPLGEQHCIRFCTSWSTKDGDAEELIEDIRNL